MPLLEITAVVDYQSKYQLVDHLSADLVQLELAINICVFLAIL